MFWHPKYQSERLLKKRSFKILSVMCCYAIENKHKVHCDQTKILQKEKVGERDV